MTFNHEQIPSTDIRWKEFESLLQSFRFISGKELVFEPETGLIVKDGPSRSNGPCRRRQRELPLVAPRLTASAQRVDTVVMSKDVQQEALTATPSSFVKVPCSSDATVARALIS